MKHETSSRRRTVCLAASLLLLVSALAMAGEPTVPWKNGAAPVANVSLPAVQAAVDAAADGRTHVVVQFERVPNQTQRDALATSGVQLLGYVGEGAYFATIDANMAAATGIAAVPGLRGVEPMTAEHRLHPMLASSQIPEHAVVDSLSDGRRLIALYVIFQTDVAYQTSVELVQSLGGTVIDYIGRLNGLVVEVPEDTISTLADSDAVQWIEPPLPRLTGMNDQVREATQADELQDTPYELDGSGVTVLVYDGGIARESHVDFEGRLIPFDTSALNSHATHVAGTIGGAGVADSRYRGVAPGVTILSCGLDGVGSDSPLYNNPGDMEADYNAAIEAGAMLANTSLGTNVEANGFDCAWQGDYGVTAALIDEMVAGKFGEPFRIVWAASNERSGSRCDVEGYGDYYSISPPAGAKNQICVGAVNSDDESMTTFSGWGPTDDGRLKPDVCAPGCQTAGDYAITSCSSSGDMNYTRLCGTSMASPAVCGLAALLLEDYQQQYVGQPLPRNSTLRALLVHTAVDLGTVGPDYCFGYGTVRGRDAVDLMRTAQFCEKFVDQDGRYTETVTVDPNDAELKVTLTWDDVPAAPNAEVTLVNDLDLVVTGPDGTQYYPWTLDPLAPDQPAVRTQADHINNIEQVLVENPAAGEWTIEVVGHNVPDGPQHFSLVGDGAINITTAIGLPNGVPEMVREGETYNLEVKILAFGQAVVPDSARLYYRVNDGAFTEMPLTSLGDGQYRVTLPGCDCSQVPSYYVAVETTELGTATLPENAPEATLTHSIGAWWPMYSEDFEQPGNWTTIAEAYSGNWELGDPEQSENLGIITQPEDDHSPDGTQCFVTGPLAGVHASMYDVDGGPSHLISPTFDLTGEDARVSYWLWHHMSVNMNDRFVVAVTNDGENWVTVREISRSYGEWTYDEWLVSDYIEPTATVQVRFTVNDTDPGSLIEAAIDDFDVVTLTCGATPIVGDLDDDGDVDTDDLTSMLAAYAACAGDSGYAAAADLNLSGCIDLADLQLLLAHYGETR